MSDASPERRKILRVLLRKSKDPSIEEYYCFVQQGDRVLYVTDFYIEKRDARKEAREFIRGLKVSE